MQLNTCETLPRDLLNTNRESHTIRGTIDLRIVLWDSWPSQSEP